MKKIITYGALLSVLSVTGCATMLQVNNNNDFHSTGRPQSQHVNRLFWGYVNGSVFKPACSCGIHSLTVRATFDEKVLTFLTLGIYCPTEVTWYCEEKDLTH